MSTRVFPTFAGASIEVTRSPIWPADVSESASGFEYATTYQTGPRYQWDLAFNLLRSKAAFLEFQNMLGFINLLSGPFDTFLYQDADDNAVSGSPIGIGNGSSRTFQLARTLGGYSDLILAPNVVTSVFIAGVPQNSSLWSVANWGTVTPGLLTFTSAPANGAAITATFSFYWPCRLTDQSFAMLRFLANRYEMQKLSFRSVKNGT